MWFDTTNLFKVFLKSIEMINEVPKISVLIICYRQEELIKRAINSLLAQKDYIYEICVSDDCSPDKTWEVLQEYDSKYPGLFKLHRNEPNIGIFENIEYTWTMPTGDLIYQLSGDDEVGSDWFKTVINYIQYNNIDYKKELFCIYGDYKCIYPNGDVYTFKNKKVASGKDVIRLSLRGLIGNRSCCYSIAILKRFQKVSQGRSYIAEVIQDRQLQVFAETNYYIPQVGNTYYSNIGVSVGLDKSHFEERQGMMDYYLEFLQKNNIIVPEVDKKYVKCFNAFYIFLHKKSAKTFVRYIVLYLKSGILQWGDGLISLRHLVFSILRRLPHNRPLNW